MRLFIVEDDPRLLSSLSLLLDGEADVDVVGTAGSAEEALDTIEVDGCDVVLSDLGLPNMPGEELIRVLKRRRPELEIVAYTVFDDRDSVFGALKAGASGYLLKSSTPRELVEGLTLVSRGGAPMSPRIARAVVTNASGTPRSPTCLYAPRMSSADNAGEQYVSTRLGSPLGSLVSTRAHACSYPGDDSSVRFSSHTFRNASPAPRTSPSLSVARMTTVNSSAPPAPPPREAFGSSSSALSGALLLGELASTLDAVSLAAAPGVSSSRAVRPASCLSRAASSHSSGDAVSGGFVRTVDVETSLSNCLDLSPVRVPLTR